MSKEKTGVKDNELNKVSGGWTEEDIGVSCPICGTSDIYENMFVKSEKDGCSSTKYYKCPKCGHEWKD